MQHFDEVLLGQLGAVGSAHSHDLVKLLVCGLFADHQEELAQFALGDLGVLVGDDGECAVDLVLELVLVFVAEAPQELIVLDFAVLVARR